MVAVTMAVGVITSCVPAPNVVQRDPKRTLPLPVLVIGGFEFSCRQDPNDWTAWVDAIAWDRPGSVVEHFTFDPCRSVIEAADRLGDRVDELLARTGAPAVQIVGHSQANLVVRWCIRFGSCGDRVDTLLGLAAANHGTIWGGFCPLAFWTTPGCSAMTPDGPLLRALNADDETWGNTRYVTASSWCDYTIVPSISGVLVGAENHTLSRCVGHSEWKTDPSAIAWGVDTLAGRSVTPLR
jgi:hypothetical protein